MMKKLFKHPAISFLPLAVFLFTLIYGLLHIDGGMTPKERNLPYGFLFVFILGLPVLAGFLLGFVLNLIKGLLCLSDAKSRDSKYLATFYLLVVLLLLAYFGFHFELLMPVGVASLYDILIYLFLTIVLIYLDWKMRSS